MATPRKLMYHGETEGESKVVFDQTAVWDGAKVIHTRVRAGEVREHSYPAHEISIPLDGSYRGEVQSATGKRRAGTYTVGHTGIFPAGQVISARWDGELEHLAILLDPALVVRSAAELFRAEQVELVESCSATDSLIRQIGLALLAESDAPVGRLYAESLVNLLAVHLVRHYSTLAEQSLPAFGGLARHKLRRATEFITEHLDSDLTLTEIAQAVELSPFHFARAFKQTTGLTPHQFLVKARIDRAKRLLVESELPIVEVSARVGFKNQSHFTTLFRKVTALTPKAYRDATLR